LGWKINCWARFKEGDHALELIKLLLSPAGTKAGSYPNLFDAHPPFQIDGNFGGAAGIGEMIVQSHTSFIDLLPAIPTAWTEGSVKGICVRGGFVLDMTWKAGSITKLRVFSREGGVATFRYKGLVIPLKTTKGAWAEIPF
jgi:alpha-L-fucosidase 2